MAIDPKELAKLSPEERIKKLRQLEEEGRKDADEIGALIKKSMQELRTDKLATDITPERKQVDISKLFEEEGERLERTVKKERPSGKAEYQSFMQTYQDYSSLKKMMGYAAEGALTEDHLKIVDKIGERLDRTKYERLSDEVANMLVASRSALHKIRKYAGM
jgi:hypothetical protein